MYFCVLSTKIILFKHVKLLQNIKTILHDVLHSSISILSNKLVVIVSVYLTAKQLLL